VNHRKSTVEECARIRVAVPPVRVEATISLDEGDRTHPDPGVRWQVLDEARLARLRRLGDRVLEWVRASDEHAARFGLDPVEVLRQLTGGADDDLLEALRREREAHRTELPWGEDVHGGLRFTAVPADKESH
jgi:hypothetical protein